MTKKKHNTESQADQAPENAPAEEQPEMTVDMSAAEVDETEQLREQLQQAKDQALRAHAELDNYRKRAARELEDQRRYAGLPLMRDILPVLDNMHRAIEAAEKSHDAAGLLDGFKMMTDQLEGVLRQHDCVEIAALDEPFDPHLHEAVLQQPSDDHPANTVMQVLQTGFLLHDRVVRPSQVIVSAAGAVAEQRPTPEKDEEDADL